MRLRALFLSAVLAATFGSTSWAQEPGWWGVVIATGEDQARIEATPIIRRPYRPLHVYGNTVRRRYYRGTAVPRPRDFAQGGWSLIARRTR
jgi:hypothetical protein